MDIVSHLKLDPLTIFYYEEEDVLIWKEFIEQQTTTKVIPPTFQQLPTTDNKVETRYNILMHYVHYISFKQILYSS